MLAKRARDWLPAVGVFVAGIGIWQGFVKGLGVQRFLLPRPSAIWTAFSGYQNQLWHEGWFTFQEAARGLRDRLYGWNPLRRRRRALGPARERADAVRDRRECHPDHRVRADHERWFDPLTKTPADAS